MANKCCISFDSYIKPQLAFRSLKYLHVVYHLIPTSNHNQRLSTLYAQDVVYLLIPTSNHNQNGSWTLKDKLYIF